MDCTVGLGGHTRALLEAGASRVIGLDRDTDALALAAASLAAFGDRVELVHADYRSLGAVLAARGIEAIDGALGDLGVSSLQFDAEGRGFSFRRDEPLDMRMDRSTRADRGRPDSGDRARSISPTSSSNSAKSAIRGGSRARSSTHAAGSRSRRPASWRRSCAARCRTRGWQRIDPATRTFQALRIWVNGELDGLDTFLRGVVDRLRDGRRMVVISFHSLEDRIVKHTFRALERADALVRVLTKRPIVPGDEEIGPQSRARAAPSCAPRNVWRMRPPPEAHDGSLRLRDQQGHPEQPDRP